MTNETNQRISEVPGLAEHLEGQMSYSGVMLQDVKVDREQAISAYIFDVVEQGERKISAHKRIGVFEEGIARQRDFASYLMRDGDGLTETRTLEYLKVEEIRKLNSDRVCLTVSLGTGESTQIYFGGEEEDE
jgi:hypothetical protein